MHMHAQHTHQHDDINGRNLLISTVLNFTITIAEIIGGVLSNSLALISDAIHNLGDAFAVLLAYIANRVGKRKPTETKTFGYKRIEILAALLNAVILLVIIVFLGVEAIKRFNEPEPIKGLIMFIVASIGLLANLLSVVLLKKDSKKNINIKAAYLHLLGDTVSSAVVIIGAVLIYFFQIFWIDPLITILIGLYIFKETFMILKEAVDILMQGTPKNMDLEKIREAIEKLPEILNIHHVHAWNLNDEQIHFECHADLKDDILISKTEKIRADIEAILLNKFAISHVTIQLEYGCCEDTDMIKRKMNDS